MAQFDFAGRQWFKNLMDLGFLKDIPQAHLLVAGEIGIDEYIWGDTHRISPEAPVPVIEVQSQSYKLGLAANVAQNLTSLGAKVTMVSVLGEDRDGESLKEMMRAANIGDAHYIKDPSRPTLRKVRVIAQKQHVVRVDYERSHALDAKLAKEFTDSICDNLKRVDGIIVQDYGKGLWNSDTMAFTKYAKQLKKPVFVDPSRMSSLSLYRGTTLLTPNVAEAETLTGMIPERMQDPKNSDRVKQITCKILQETEAECAIITCGEQGMVSMAKNETELRHIPTFAREVFDVTGAGDTVIAVLSMMHVLGKPIEVCMQVANAAAGIVVGRMGASTVSVAELEAELERLQRVGLITF